MTVIVQSQPAAWKSFADITNCTENSSNKGGSTTAHIYAPQTFYTKKMVRFAAKGEPDKRKFFWMWNPQNYGDYFKSTIIYESYPTSQDEVDDILAHLRLRTRVFYDP